MNRRSHDDHPSHSAAAGASLPLGAGSSPAPPMPNGRSEPDHRLALALQQGVPVPDGLAQRLMAVLVRPVRPADAAAGDDESTAPEGCPTFSCACGGQAAVAADSPQNNRPASAEPPARRWRRRWLWAAIASAASVAVGFGLWQWQGQGEVADPLATSAVWLAQVEGRWNDRDAPAEFAPPAMFGPLARGWQWINARSRRGVVWLLAPRGPAADYLFVVRQALGQQFGPLPGSPPREPQSSTGGRCCGLWRTDAKVYLLCIDGDVRQYQSFIRSPDLALVGAR